MKVMLIFVLGVMMIWSSFAADTGPAAVDKEMQTARAQVAKKALEAVK
jgi:putative Mn2+ efflux pump MntP